VVSSLLRAAATATSGHPLGGISIVSRATATPGANPGGATVLDRAPERVRKPSPRCKVLLHNDPVNTMEYVVATLRHVVPSLSEQDAIAVMLETHNTGVGLVIVCDIEPAEITAKPSRPRGSRARSNQKADRHGPGCPRILCADAALFTWAWWGTVLYPRHWWGVFLGKHFCLAGLVYRWPPRPHWRPCPPSLPCW
jgi:ATP-dependent Clp protease adaptor protein ClpS